MSAADEGSGPRGLGTLARLGPVTRRFDLGAHGGCQGSVREQRLTRSIPPVADVLAVEGQVRAVLLDHPDREAVIDKVAGGVEPLAQWMSNSASLKGGASLCEPTVC